MGWNSYGLVAIEADDTHKGLLNYYTFVSFEIFQEYFFNSNNSDMNTNFSFWRTLLKAMLLRWHIVLTIKVLNMNEFDVMAMGEGCL